MKHFWKLLSGGLAGVPLLGMGAALAEEAAAVPATPTLDTQEIPPGSWSHQRWSC